MSNSKFKIQNSKLKYLLFAFLIFNFAFTSCVFGQIASGGVYTLEKSVTAGGGASGAGASTGGVYSVEGTIGQFAVKTQSQNSPFTFQPGFWNAAPLAPTAASVALGGRVLSGKSGVGNVRVVLTMPGGETRTAISNTFGYYRFENVLAGETYVLTVYSKRFVFSNPTLVLTLFEAREDVDFIAEESGEN
jgi:hypothetical protein